MVVCLFCESIVRCMLAKIFFDADDISEKGHEALTQLNLQFRELMNQFSVKPQFMLKSDKTTKETKKIFAEFSSEFLNAQLAMATQEIRNQTDQSQKHVLAIVIQDLMLTNGLSKEDMRNMNEEQVKKYLSKVGDLEIPAKTSIIIELPNTQKKDAKWNEIYEQSNRELKKLPQTSDYKFFSAGKRRCPDFKIAEYIFKSIMAEIIQGMERELKESMPQINKNNCLMM